jgi:DNA-binding transcriptional LysR family regulator
MRRHPDLASLRLLVETGKRGSLGKAARVHTLSQPAASKRIASLEGDLGVQLLDRTATGSTLTADGRVVVDWAQQVLGTVDQLLGAVASLRAGRNSDLCVAASMTIAEQLMPVWLSDLRSAHPDLHVGLEVANSEHVQELVLHEKVELGFVEGPSIDERLVVRRVAMDRLAVVVAPGHEWAHRRQALTRSQLLETQLVVREAGSGTRLTLDRLLADDLAAKPLLELGSNEAVKGAVIAGAGPAVLSVLAVATELEAGRLVEIDVHGVTLTRRLVAVWPRGAQLTEPSRWLLRAATHR